MKILVLSPRLPHAQVVGGHGIVYQRLRRLAGRGHDIGLAVFAQPDDAAHLPEWKGLLRETVIVPAPPRRHGVLRALASPVPAIFAGFRSEAMIRAAGQLAVQGGYEIALAEFGVMGQHLHRNPHLPAVRKVISVHQCHTLAAQRALSLGSGPLRALAARLQLARLEPYEFGMYRCADHLLALTPEVRMGMLQRAPSLRISVIPSGVDTVYFRPGSPHPKEQALVFTGDFTDEANADAALWFIRDVWPRLAAGRSDLVFYLVGPRPPPALVQAGERDPRIVVTGEVDDIRPYLAKAMVFVCPNRMGSGMRGKILQAMAAGVPVVSTTLGAEGIPIQMGDDGFLADTAEIMAQYAGLLLEDESLRASVSAQARAMVSERFSWERGVDQLEHVLQETVA
ncbi:MAG: glycosyltransferase family 4 protein [Verrucomicrobia bacterium]|nr:glycosyltransferase family 4 protein [Verrucomicrobiota bacterium]